MNSPTPTTRKALMDEADNLVYRMRELAGTGSIDEAASIVKEALELLNDASAYDRNLPDDHEDSGVALNYVLDMTHLVADNIRGIPSGNRSRTAQQARRVA